jgi:hypothetical protein
VPDESSDKPETTSPNAPEAGGGVEASEAEAEAVVAASLDPMSPEAIAKRVAALGGEDETDRIAREEELKLAERRAKAGGGKKKPGLEAAASKRLQQIGGKAVPPKRVALAADANPLLAGTGRFGEWVRKNQSLVVGASVVALAAIVGGGGYVWWAQKTELGASTTITEAVSDELGRIGDPAKEEDEDTRPKDARPVFKTDADRRDAALAKYRDVETKYKGTGAAYLARLEEGSLLLDKPDLDGALAAFQDASKSPLAAADPEVKGRALEGMGLAYEAKSKATPADAAKWLGEAMQQFHALENTDVKGFKELGMYHQARVAEALGDKDKAITLLKALRERLDQPGENHPFVYLESVTDDRLRALDPTAIKPKPKGQMGGPGGNNMTEEQIQKLIEQMKAKSGIPGGGGK